MNSYHENLSAVITTALQNQGLEEKAVFSKQNAAVFTLYFAQGAAIAAEKKLIESATELETKTLIMQQTVKNSNLSNNLLLSSTQANQYFKTGVTNAAVCAANVQVATNAIVKLASDMGSIFSIINAADYDSDIFEKAREANSLISSTAYGAELASKLAMEASASTAEVSVQTVFDKSKSANSEINNLLQITTTDFNEIAAILNTNQINLASVIAKEKLAEGEFESNSIAFESVQEAYRFSNKELNIDLMVSKTPNSDSIYQFRFNQINNPFDNKQVIKNYYLILVKENKKNIFSITSAENIIVNNNPSQCIELADDSLNSVCTQKIDLLGASPVIDADGDAIILGINYVAFVMAIYLDSYKKTINNFDDFLSAPSKPFMLSHTLPIANKITVQQKKVAEGIELNAEYKLSFNTKQKTLNSCSEYRCVFLPKNSGSDNLTNVFKTNENLHDDINLGFYFSLAIAEQISASNYTVAKVDDEMKSANQKNLEGMEINLNWMAFIDAETTDNFGNLLIDKKEYYPVILSIPKLDTPSPEKYTNVLSFANKSFQFNANKIK